jgi:hypothetical protein
MAKLVEFHIPWHKLSAHMIIADKVDTYIGRGDSWGIGIEYNHYERALTLHILNLYMGFQVWYKNEEE